MRLGEFRREGTKLLRKCATGSPNVCRRADGAQEAVNILLSPKLLIFVSKKSKKGYYLQYYHWPTDIRKSTDYYSKILNIEPPSQGDLFVKFEAK